MRKLQPVRGTKEILEEEHRQIVFITNYWQYITSAYGFNMIQTPIIEDSEVFKKTLGMTSDIIKKETYTFKDRSENEITLRPEGTAPVVRYIINNKLHHSLPQKLSYQGEMFRYDRPQKGRLREFYQLGLEVIGEKDISADITDRHVIIVEDIIDSGLTIKFIYDRLLDAKPKSLSIAALLMKPELAEIDFEVNWVGFEIPPDFVVGYGLDYEQKFRNLKGIYSIGG